jgi:predicted enzyme related to lactoylglutathione lyase
MNRPRGAAACSPLRRTPRSEHQETNNQRRTARLSGVEGSIGVGLVLPIRAEAIASAGHTPSMPAPLIEFPADDPDRARRFWHGILGVTLEARPAAAGSGWQTDTDGLLLGVHRRGPGPGDTASLTYFTVADLPATLEHVRELGGSVIHPGDRWAVCRDSEGSPFALAAALPPAA